MSRATWINELVDAGYDAGVLDTLNNNELAELVQEEFVANKWTEAARAARHLRGRATKHHIRQAKSKRLFRLGVSPTGGKVSDLHWRSMSASQRIGHGLNPHFGLQSTGKLRKARKITAKRIKELRKTTGKRGVLD